MRLTKLLILIVFCAALGTSETAWPAQKEARPPLDLKGKTVKQVFEELLPGMGAKDLPARQNPQQQWQAICTYAGAPGNEALRAEVCKLMIDKLDAKTPSPARVWLLWQLEFIGRGEAVAPVAALLEDADDQVRDAAVRCLANNPTPEATAKLLARLAAAGDKDKVALLNALGFRKDPSTVVALAKELAAKTPAVAVAAARALGKIRSPEAAEVLAAARKQARDEVRFWITDSYLLCADQRLKEGKEAAARAIYKELNNAQEARPIRLAALRGVLKTAGDEAGTLILEAIAGNDADARTVAIAQIETISPAALKALAASIDKLPPAGQALLLGALAARGDKSQMPVAVAAAKSKQESIRRAGLRALGRLGDASAVPLLTEAVFANPNIGTVARDSLVALTGAGVNEKIIAALREEKNNGRRGTLIGVLEARRAAEAVPVLLEEARGNDAGLRSTAMTALRQLAEPKEVPALIQALRKAEKGREREEAERTIVAVCGRITEPENRAEPVLGVITAGTEADKAALLPLLGRIGGARALRVIKDALASSTETLHDAGVQALCNWPEPSVSEELLKLAQGERTAEQRLLALRSLIRVNSVPGETPNAARLGMLKKAMELATRDEERTQVLDGLATVKDIGTLRYVLPYLDNKDLAQRACKTVVELAHSKTLREPNKAEFDKALDRVIALCKDKGLVDRAKRYKEGF